MKTAIVHDWFYSVTGAEKVVEAIYSCFPSPIYTLIKYEKNLGSLTIPLSSIRSSFIEKLPFGKTHYPYYFPFFPYAIESFNIEADLILSSSSCVAKNVLTRSDQLHICYCHTPVRYLWDSYFDYLRDHHLENGVKGLLTKFFFHKLRNWDLIHSPRVDFFIANSKHVARRIFKTYKKEAIVIYPPVDTELFKKSICKKENFYITVSRLVPYKKIDLMIEAFNQMLDKTFLIVGDGPELGRLKKLANKNIHFINQATNDEVSNLVARAQAFIFMSYEDFGIVTLEAQAAATPVIAYKKGGSLETIIDNKTGILFDEQSLQSLCAAIKRFESSQDLFDPIELTSHAERFSKKRFLQEYKSTVHNLYERYKNG